MTTAIINAKNLSIFASIQIAILRYKTQRAYAAWIYIDFSRIRPLLCTRNVATNNDSMKNRGFSPFFNQNSSSLGKVWKLNEFFFLPSETGENVRFVMTLSHFFHTNSNHNNEKQELFGVEEKIMKTFAVKTLGAVFIEVFETSTAMPGPLLYCEKLSEKFLDKAFLASVCPAD